MGTEVRPTDPLVDYGLLIEMERVRFQSDFSSSHWLFQVIEKYRQGMPSKLRRDAFEAVMRCAKNCGCRAAVELAGSYPPAAGFPGFLSLSNAGWDETCRIVLGRFDQHIENRFRYRHEGD